MGQHLLRYLACVVLKDEDHESSKKLAEVLIKIEHSLRDPLSSLIILLMDCNYKQCKSILKDCDRSLEYDFFVSANKKQIILSAVNMISSNHSKLYYNLDLNTLEKKFGLG